MIKLMFFGRFTDITTSREIVLPQGVSTIAELARWLGDENDALREALSQTGVRVARNQIMTDFNDKISDGDEIAFMSALSGG